MWSAVLAVILSRLLILGICTQIDVGTGLLEKLNQWDSHWYRSIVYSGYDLEPHAHEAGDAANWAFFPLMPIIVRLAVCVLSVDAYLIANILNTLYFWGALVFAGLYVYQDRQSLSHAFYFQWLSAFGAYNFYFFVAYTEALFLLLVVAFFYFMRNKRYVLMGVIGALCSATRNIGVFLAFAIAVFYTQEYLNNNRNRSLLNWLITAVKQPRLVFGVLLIPLGLFVYMHYLHNYVGDGLAFMHIQRAWGGGIQNPIKTLIEGVTSVGSIEFYYSLFAILWIVSIYRLLEYKKIPEMVVSFVFLLIPLSVRLQSMPRYMIGCFLPMYGLLLDYSEWRCTKKAIIFVVSLFWGVFCLKQWILGMNWLV